MRDCASSSLKPFPDPKRPLPNEWRRARLDDITARASGHTPDQGKPEYWNGGVDWVSLADSAKLDHGYIEATDKQISHLGIRHSSAVLLPPETVILSRDAGVGKSAVLKHEMAVSQHFIAWSCSPKNVLDPWFLYAWMQVQKPFFERMAVGSTIKTIGLPIFKRVTIDFPPLPEQRKIAEILRTWDTALEALTTLRKAKARRFEGLRDKLMAAASRIGRRALFGDFLTESREPGTDGATARKISVRLYGKGAVEKIDTRGGSSSTRYYRRKAGQLIWSKLDFLNGAFALLGPELDGYESTLDLPAFDLSDAVNPIWLIEYLTRPAYYTRQIHLARGQRKARRVSPEDWLASPVRLPDRRTQDRIAEILSTARHELTLIDAEIEALTRQKRGLMQKLLTGEWRVTPAASDDDHPEKEAHHAQ